MNLIQNKIKECVQNITALSLNAKVLEKIEAVSSLIIKSLKNKGKVLVCGNGGSAADAQHFAGEFLCRFYKNRRPLPCIALTTDSSTLTAIANDYSYDQVFSRQVEALSNAGDVLIGISTSGSSKNVFEAFKIAKTKGVQTVLLTGAALKEIAAISDLVINVHSLDTPRIQEMHLIIEHIICEIVEQEFCE